MAAFSARLRTVSHAVHRRYPHHLAKSLTAGRRRKPSTVFSTSSRSTCPRSTWRCPSLRTADTGVVGSDLRQRGAVDGGVPHCGPPTLGSSGLICGSEEPLVAVFLTAGRRHWGRRVGSAAGRSRWWPGIGSLRTADTGVVGSDLRQGGAVGGGVPHCVPPTLGSSGLICGREEPLVAVFLTADRRHRGRRV